MTHSVLGKVRRGEVRRATALFLAAAFFTLSSGLALAENPGTHVVQRGETLYSLAKRYGTNVSVLAQLNGVGPDFVIRVGQRLVLPAVATPAAPGTAMALETIGDKVYATMRPASEVSGRAGWAGERGVLVGRPPQAVEAPAPTAAAGMILAPAAPEVPAEPAGVTSPAMTTSPASAAMVVPCTAEERLLLARLVVAEAGNEPAEGQVGVAAVVVNRVRHPGFPKSIAAVIQEPGQFKAVELGRVQSVEPDPAVLAVVDRALTGEDPTQGALFFYNPVKSVALDFWRTRPVTAVIGGHNFAR